MPLMTNCDYILMRPYLISVGNADGDGLPVGIT
jgi:hypothetical protein